MSNSNALINIDLDGVVYDFADEIRWWCEIELDRVPLPAVTDWHFWREWGLSDDEWPELFRTAVIEGEVFAYGRPYPGAIERINQLQEKGWTIRFVTHKNILDPEATRAAQRQTVDWLYEHGIGMHQLAFAADKSRFDADVIIDDKPDLSWVQKGRMNLLFAQPWNERATLFAPPNVRRVRNGWDGIARLLI